MYQCDTAVITWLYLGGYFFQERCELVDALPYFWLRIPAHGRCSGGLIDAAGAVAAIGELRGGGGSASEEGREVLRGDGGREGEWWEGGVDCAGRAGPQRQELAVRAAGHLLEDAGRGRGGVAVPRSHDGDGADDIVVLVVPDGSRRRRHSSALLCQSLGKTVLLLPITRLFYDGICVPRLRILLGC